MTVFYIFICFYIFIYINRFIYVYDIVWKICFLSVGVLEYELERRVFTVTISILTDIPSWSSAFKGDWRMVRAAALLHSPGPTSHQWKMLLPYQQTKDVAVVKPSRYCHLDGEPWGDSGQKQASCHLSLGHCTPPSLTVCLVWVYSRVRLCDPMACSSPGSSVHEIIQEKMGVGCCFLLQGIFLTQGLNPHLLHCRQILYHCKETQDGEAQDPGPREWDADQRNSFSELNSCIFPCIKKS